MNRWLARLLVVATGVAVVGIAAPALAACPALDLTCSVSETPDEVTDEPTDVLDPVVDDLTGTVDPIVHNVAGTVEGVVDDLVDGNGEPPGGGSGGDGSGGGSHGPGGGSWSGGGGPVPSQRPAERQGASSDVATGGRDEGSGSQDGTPGGSDAEQRPTAERLASLVGESFALLLVLFGITVGFVLIQNRLDGRDPRLALAPSSPETVEFA